MTTLLESGAKPFGSSKGALLSMLIHGGIIAGAVYGTSQVVLPPREKVEEHPVLYVASPPPPPVQVAPKPLPTVKEPPKAKAPQPQKVFVAPRRVATPPQPQPKVPATPALVAPTKVPLTLSVNLQAAPTISDVVAPPPSDAISSKGGVSRGGSVKSDGDGDGEARGKGGLSSGSSGKAYDENTVDRAVSVTRAASPRYPESLKSVGVEGVVAMRFIVGADGRVEPGSIDVISTPHKLFADAVRKSLLETRYRPAEANGHPVRQVVEQTFSFKIEK
ncbi:MAG: TonB family protein [Gemmatimonadaceae bacterium]